MLYSELAPSLNSNNISEAEQLTQLRSAIFQICEQLDIEMPQASESSTSTSSASTTSDTFETLNVISNASVGGTLSADEIVFDKLTANGDFVTTGIQAEGSEVITAGGYVDMGGWVYISMAFSGGSSWQLFKGLPAPRISTALSVFNMSSGTNCTAILERYDEGGVVGGRLSIAGFVANETYLVSGWYRK